MSSNQVPLLTSLEETAEVRHRGGSMRVVFSPGNGCKDGLLGRLVLKPGEIFGRHYHPFSDECLLIESGSVEVELADQTYTLVRGNAVHIPRNTPHKLQNDGVYDAVVVFALFGVAPASHLGHVDLGQSASTAVGAP